MTIANTVNSLLLEQGINFAVVCHPPTSTSLDTAEVAHIPGNLLAKGVLLHDEEGYVLAVIPAPHIIDYVALQRVLGRTLQLAPETAVRAIFSDCVAGALPHTGTAYGIETIVDQHLFDQNEVYMEAGDHREVIRVSALDFRSLMFGAESGPISRHR